MQWVCAALEDSILDCFFSLLGQLQLVGQQQLAYTFLGQQEHLRLGSEQPLGWLYMCGHPSGWMVWHCECE